MSAGKFIAGFVVGGIVGAITGVLLAPQSGEETREKIKESSQKAYDKAHSAVKEIQEKAENVSNEMAKKGDFSNIYAINNFPKLSTKYVDNKWL